MYKYLHAGARYDTKTVLTDNIYKNYLLTGQNTGNLLIGHATHTFFETSEYAHLFVPFSSRQIEYYKKNFDKKHDFRKHTPPRVKDKFNQQLTLSDSNKTKIAYQFSL